jgi:hypothetical protein
MGFTSLEGNAVRLLSLILTLIFIFSIACPIYGAANENQKPTLIIVVGASGAPEYEVQFSNWADLWRQACLKGNVNPVLVGLDSIQDSNDLEIIQKVIDNEQKESSVPLWLVLIGHGTFDSKTAKFNLKGPDLSAKTLAQWLKPFNRPIIVIDTSSSSAPFLGELAGPNRVIITATKSGYELNYTRFGQYFADALAEPEADLDKDGQTSLLETFLIASHRVAEFYEGEGRLATEHALLDDNGDGLGTAADWFRGIRPVKKPAEDANLDGYRAHQFHLVKSVIEEKMPSEWREKRNQLELEVIKLRDSKNNYSEDEYFSRLEKLLYEMAKIYEELEKAYNPS